MHKNLHGLFFAFLMIALALSVLASSGLIPDILNLFSSLFILLSVLALIGEIAIYVHQQTHSL